MTTIAYRGGIIAADSRETWEGEAGGTSIMRCTKLYRKRVAKRDVILATAGASFTGMVFVDWYGSGKDVPTSLTNATLEEDFDVVILDRGKVYVSNHMCRPVEIDQPFFSVGSGRKAAMGAMHCGRTAKGAVEIACLVDPFTAPPIVTMSMPS
jgi:ATP-dependent protease HslVU (ClpYQ) peptidase subunit